MLLMTVIKSRIISIIIVIFDLIIINYHLLFIIFIILSIDWYLKSTNTIGMYHDSQNILYHPDYILSIRQAPRRRLFIQALHWRGRREVEEHRREGRANTAAMKGSKCTYSALYVNQPQDAGRRYSKSW